MTEIETVKEQMTQVAKLISDKGFFNSALGEAAEAAGFEWAYGECQDSEKARVCGAINDYRFIMAKVLSDGRVAMGSAHATSLSIEDNANKDDWWELYRGFNGVDDEEDAEEERELEEEGDFEELERVQALRRDRDKTLKDSFGEWWEEESVNQWIASQIEVSINFVMDFGVTEKPSPLCEIDGDLSPEDEEVDLDSYVFQSGDLSDDLIGIQELIDAASSIAGSAWADVDDGVDVSDGWSYTDRECAPYAHLFRRLLNA
jgi:hypothetical protein